MKNTYPKTINDAIETIINLMEKEVLKIICTMPVENVDYFHKGFNTWICNHTGLFDENYELMADCNAKDTNDASLVILKALKEHLNNNKYKYGLVEYGKNE